MTPVEACRFKIRSGLESDSWAVNRRRGNPEQALPAMTSLLTAIRWVLASILDSDRVTQANVRWLFQLYFTSLLFWLVSVRHFFVPKSCAATVPCWSIRPRVVFTIGFNSKLSCKNRCCGPCSCTFHPSKMPFCHSRVKLTSFSNDV